MAQSIESEGADNHDTAMAQSKGSEEAGNRDGCATVVVRAQEFGDQPYQPRRASLPKVSCTVDMVETCACVSAQAEVMNKT